MTTADSDRIKELPTPLVIALSVMMMMCVIGAYFYYERVYQNGFANAQRDHVLAELNSLHSRLDNALNRNMQVPNTLNSYVLARGDISESEFHKLAVQMHEENQESVRSIQVARGTTITYIYPLDGNQQVVGIDLLTLPKQSEAVRQTIASKMMLMAGPLKLVQ